ncbi:MAG TPA: lysophospholipid acyltransferase family protein [Alphaproteobacteria bacterium]|nr:lysophospholipid acyltransferase family protein [Alphaproteobacteria bacterium]
MNQKTNNPSPKCRGLLSEKQETWLRSLSFTIAFYGWSFLIMTISLPCLPLSRQATFECGRLWVRVTCWLLREITLIRHQFRGLENIPNTPVIFAVKHQSAWETLTFLLVSKQPAFVLKRELLWVPLFGWFMWGLNMISINRRERRRSMQQLLQNARLRLTQGRSIVIFPEGTRMPPGQTGPYHAGIAALYQHLNVPVVPVALNSGKHWRRKSLLKCPGTITMEFLPPLLQGLDKQQFLNTLRQQIEAASTRLDI